MTKEELRFLRLTDDLGIIANTAVARVDLQTLQAQFGMNFNTLFIKNNSTEELKLSMDGQDIITISKGDAFGMDWRDNIQYTDVEITNLDSANSTAANEIRISVGRTGPSKKEVIELEAI